MRSQVLVEKASSYVTIRAMGFPVAFLNTAIWGVCLANRDTLTPLVISLLSMVLNLVVRPTFPHWRSVWRVMAPACEGRG